ncbi:GGDEF domain-containing protein [Hahella sp. HN01]|uniref:GGDEF domain-containing protein n=1 Tax=Hahella sp. HN01 TaxID=2847262 RepID=UPI001C1ED5AC|nr:GGDEF domain-containing protein [Hahella sp. HN01]MBU6952208.1 GGDEF domain-containing protein [Hahella sp. HN01]
MDSLEELFARARKNEEIARNLFDIEVAILNVAKVQPFLEHLLQTVQDKFGVKHVWYAMVESAHTESLIKTLKASPDLAGKWVCAPSVEYLAATKGAREPLMGHADLYRFFFMTPPEIRTQIRSIAILPLILEGRLAGSLNLAADDQERYRADKECFFLRQLSVKASLCLSSVVAREKIADLATRDPLTQLRNRREMEDALDVEISRAARNEQPLALAFIDCDDFKLVNDAYGHDVGDEYLKHVADGLCVMLRKSDQAFRFAGDEFVVLLPDQDQEGAEQIAERLCDYLYANPLVIDDMRIPVKVSIGVASTSQIGTGSARSLLKLADKRLYEKKKRKPCATARLSSQDQC